MANWYLAPSLSVLRSEVNTRWPGRDHTSDGTIGDADHQTSHSDHNPNIRGSVDAWDMDKDGVDVDAVIAAFQRHPSAHYWIWRRQIADRDTGWRRQTYGGENPHTQHVHFSIRQTVAAELDRRSWGLLEDDDMATAAEIWSAKFGPANARVTAGQLLAEARRDAAAALAEVVKLTTLVEALAGADARRDAELRAVLAEHGTGSLDAEEVVRRMGQLLSATAPE